MNRYTPRFAGRMYREDGIALVDYRDAADGSTTYGLALTAPEAPAIEWTEHTSTCFACRRRFRISRDALALAKEDWAKGLADYREDMTDAEVSDLFDVCIECVDGEHHEGEHVD